MGHPPRWAWPAVFLACLAGAGLRSVALGKDANWDLKNYHWYNAWALFNDRLGADVAPAQLQTYHNPLGDLPFYGLVNTFEEPRVVAFLMAASTGIAAFFLLRILALLFPFDRARANGGLWIASSAAIGLTGAAGVASWGTTMNEWPSAALVSAALWIAMRAAIHGEARAVRAFAAAGFLAGCAVGLKLTYGVFALGLLAGFAAGGSLRERVERVVAAALAMAAGFLACYGWWGWILWREFANPFFPYFNAIFESPWWEPRSFFDANFGPRHWRHWLFFPLYFARQSLLVGEVGFRDYRLATLLVAALLAWALARFHRLRENPLMAHRSPEPATRAWRILAVFTLVSYLAWLKLFGIYRYLVPLELFSGALIVGCVLYVVRHGRARIALVVVLAGLLVGTTRPGSWGRIEFGERYFEIAAPQIAPGALVIVGYRHPMAYAIAFFRPDARFVAPASNLLDPTQSNRLARRAAALIRNHRGPLYLLEYRDRLPHDERTLAHFGLTANDAGCMPVPSTFEANHMRICPLVAAAR